MAKIIDPDLLNQNIEITIDSTNYLIELHQDVGNLSADGVSLVTLYSFLKKAWKEDPRLPKHPFPMSAVTDERFVFINNWEPKNDETIALFRDGGFSIDHDGVSVAEWMGFTTIGDLAPDATNQIYYIQDTTGPTQYCPSTGHCNFCVPIYGDADHGNFDYRDYFRTFIREQGYTYTSSNLNQIGFETLTYRQYRFPLTTLIDPKADLADTLIDSNSDSFPDIDPYDKMKIYYLDGSLFEDWSSGTEYFVGEVVTFNGRWFICDTQHISNDGPLGTNDLGYWNRYDGERQIGDTWYPFNRIVDVRDSLQEPSVEDIYNFTRFSLRQDRNINDSTSSDQVIGLYAEPFFDFLGDFLRTRIGVYIDGYSSTDTERIAFRDVNNNTALPPFVASGIIRFDEHMVQDGTDAVYRMYFVDPSVETGDEFGYSGALTVKDADGNDIGGRINGRYSISFSYDYDTNTQGGRTPGTDAEVIVVAVGLSTAKYISVTGTITRDAQNEFVLTCDLEQNYISYEDSTAGIPIN